MKSSVTRYRRRRAIRSVPGAVVAIAGLSLVVGPATSYDASAQESYQRISGEGSSWSANAIDAMRVNVKQFGITVDYAATGSTSGRKNYLNGTVDFAASDIPFQFAPEDGSAPENPEPDSYAYVPVTAGGTAFMYNLKINGQPVTNLRLSGENVSRIFTGAATMWNDASIQADNPGLTLPARPIVPVVRSDGSGSTAQFTQWMINRHPGLWNDYCARVGRTQCGFTSFYPTIQGMIGQSGDLGVAGYVSQSFAEGAIGYVNYSYALGVQFPVAKVLNAAGYYTEPTPENVSVSLLQARINTDASNLATYLTQDLSGVYTDGDPRNYQLSSYSYFILPTKVRGQFSEAKGRTLGAFAYYAMCQAQQQSASLGYSPLPINLVTASFDQIRRIPGVEVQTINVEQCNNPTFSPDGTNVLARDAPQPQACDQQGSLQCPDGTGGMRNVPTATANPTVTETTQPAATDGGQTGGGVTPNQPDDATATTQPAQTGSAGQPNQSGQGGTGQVAQPGGSTSNGAGGATTTTTTVVGGQLGGSGGDGGGSAIVDPATGAPEALDPATGQPLVVDPATGQPTASGDPVAQSVAPGAIATVTLDDPTSWGGRVALLLVIVLLLAALIVGPALAARHLKMEPSR